MLYKALLQDSDNGIAEALLAMISQSHFEKMDIQKTIDTLQNQWSTWLPDPLEWVDGSGISRYNMVTPRTLIAVLKKIHQRVGWQKIQTYFPKSGVSGTLTAYPNLKNVYAKTGTLRHNHNLSGYWESPKGNKYAFSIMVNHYTDSYSGNQRGNHQTIAPLSEKTKLKSITRLLISLVLKDYLAFIFPNTKNTGKNLNSIRFRPAFDSYFFCKVSATL